MNMKLVLMAAGAFVIGLGGSTAAVVMTAPVKIAPAAAATATHGAAPAGDTTATHAAGAAHSATPATPPQPPGESTIARNSLGQDPHALAPLEAPAATARAASMESAAGYRQVARVLSSMKPADAAKIAAFPTDDQVEGILGQLGVRQAASLLTQLPTERAALLSKRIMIHTEAK